MTTSDKESDAASWLSFRNHLEGVNDDGTGGEGDATGGEGDATATVASPEEGENRLDSATGVTIEPDQDQEQDQDQDRDPDLSNASASDAAVPVAADPDVDVVRIRNSQAAANEDEYVDSRASSASSTFEERLRRKADEGSFLHGQRTSSLEGAPRKSNGGTMPAAGVAADPDEVTARNSRVRIIATSGTADGPDDDDSNDDDSNEGERLPSKSEEGEDNKDVEEGVVVVLPPGERDSQVKRRLHRAGTDVGASHVDQQAPQINRRFYLGLDRPSARRRRNGARRERRAAGARGRRAREEEREAAAAAEAGIAAEEEEEGGGNRRRASGLGRHLSTLFAHATHSTGHDAEQPARLYAEEHLVSATLVPDNDGGEVVTARRVGILDQKGRMFAVAAVLLTALSATLAGILVGKPGARDGADSPTEVPSTAPSMMPSFVPGPTFERVRARGHVLCGLRNATSDNFHRNLCRAIASVLFGNPDSYEGVTVTLADRFQQLHGRTVDLLLSADAHTVEREIREVTTGVGFAFSRPYYYDAMAFYGNETYVDCAERRQRHTGCSLLRICVVLGSTAFDFGQYHFPAKFLVSGSSIEEVTEMLTNGTCNVVAEARSYLLDMDSEIGPDGKFAFANRSEETEPHAIVTRTGDAEFSHIVDWAVQALFYGDEQGMKKDPSLCQNYTNSTPPSNASDLSFLNAVFCVGSYSQVCGDKLCDWGSSQNQNQNQINNGSSGMLYATPFGDFGRPQKYDADNEEDFLSARSLLDRIIANGTLNCGVIVPDGFDGKIKMCDQVEQLNMSVGMSYGFCCALGAALFFGDESAVNLTSFSRNDKSSFDALHQGTVDVLAGGEIEKKYCLATSPYEGFHFSSPYYYEGKGNDVSPLSFVTRNVPEDGAIFSSFVNLVVLATFHAEKNLIIRAKSSDMPLLPIFGAGFPSWAIRDSIFYTGNYDDLYRKNFGDVMKDERGRNYVNDDDGPLIHSFPGLSQ